MTPTLTLFKKEFHQHGIFAPAMVVMCLLFQVAYSQLCYFFNATIDAQIYFGLAIVITALYAGAAAALAYPTEHADGTFIFLRKMPITPLMLALGKTSWVLCGTVLVLLGNLLLSFAWGGDAADVLWLAFGVGILEALVWGFYWSTRCRSQIHAILAGYACASITIHILVNLFIPYSSDTAGMYAAAVPYRLAACGVVGLLAVRGMSRWFKYESQRPLVLRFIPENLLVFRYPQKVQTPFFALMHQHLRHVSLLYWFGMVCFALFSFGCVYLYVVHDRSGINNPLQTELWLMIGTCICIGGILAFWGNIFGHDQSGDSYRFLSRLGIPEGHVWWSRMLFPFILYLSVWFSYTAYLFGTYIMWRTSTHYNYTSWDHFWYAGILFFATWLAPLAVGAFVSISLRSQMVAIALTGAGVGLFLAWLWLFTGFFGCNPLWTTVPLAIALLAASRIRATYWLRETNTWRSRLIPLYPVFGVMLAVFVLLPFVRLYSVPVVSWEQIESYLEQTKFHDQLPAGERKILFQKLAAGTYSQNEQDFLRAKYSRALFGGAYGDGINKRPEDPAERIRFDLGVYKTWEAESLRFEEFLVGKYFQDRRPFLKLFDSVWAHGESKNELNIPALVRTLFPWEKARMERLLRLRLLSALVGDSDFQDERAVSLAQRVRSPGIFERTSLLDDGLMEHYWFSHGYWQFRLTEERLNLVFLAVDCFYLDNKRMPESLDELVEQNYLAGIPVHPITGEPVELRFDSFVPQREIVDGSGIWQISQYSTTVVYLGLEPFPSHENARERGLLTQCPSNYHGTFLRLGERFIVIMEEPEAEQHSEPESEPQPEGRDSLSPPPLGEG